MDRRAWEWFRESKCRVIEFKPMKRRRLLQSLVALPAVQAIPVSAQTPAASLAADSFKVAVTGPDAVAQSTSHYFNGEQKSALENLGDLFMPKMGERPGAKEAETAGFLEFLISQSPADRQELYRNGLDRLNSEAKHLYGKPFGAITGEQAAPILNPVATPWTYNGPQDPFARFLIAAKEDFLRATGNSRSYARSGTTRGSGGSNYYWLPIE